MLLHVIIATFASSAGLFCCEAGSKVNGTAAEGLLCGGARLIRYCTVDSNGAALSSIPSLANLFEPL